jgi:hypothetical protein
LNDLYNENYKMPVKEIKEHTKIRKDMTCLWIRRICLVHCPCSPKQSTDRFCVIRQISVTLVFRSRKTTLMLVWDHKSPCIANTTQSIMNNIVGITITDLKTYHKAIVSKTAWYWHETRHRDQWTRIEYLEISLHVCSVGYWSSAKVSKTYIGQKTVS